MIKDDVMNCIKSMMIEFVKRVAEIFESENVVTLLDKDRTHHQIHTNMVVPINVFP